MELEYVNIIKDVAWKLVNMIAYEEQQLMNQLWPIIMYHIRMARREAETYISSTEEKRRRRRRRFRAVTRQRQNPATAQP